MCQRVYSNIEFRTSEPAEVWFGVAELEANAVSKFLTQKPETQVTSKPQNPNSQVRIEPITIPTHVRGNRSCDRDVAPAHVGVTNVSRSPGNPGCETANLSERERKTSKRSDRSAQCGGGALSPPRVPRCDTQLHPRVSIRGTRNGN